ncbi:MAG: hypothetical protein LBQ86_00685 [Holophagales bacterium]|jgi:hypothetical protein|nr:hypothetical protein [Holophagales bacterium]
MQHETNETQNTAVVVTESPRKRTHSNPDLRAHDPYYNPDPYSPNPYA